MVAIAMILFGMISCSGCGSSLGEPGGVESDWAKMESGTTEDLSGVWGTGPNDVFAVGGAGTILHYDGSQWNKMESGINNPLYDVWGSSQNDVYAVGTGGLILHYDGSGWTQAYHDSTLYELDGIWGTGPNDIFAVGWDGVILHYNGTTWSQMDNPLDGSTLFAYNNVWGTSSNNVYAVGSNLTDTATLHYDGSAWHQDGALVFQSGDTWTYDFRAIGGSGPDDIWVVGMAMTVNVPQSWAEGFCIHYDGTKWSPLDTEGYAQFFGVWGTDKNNIYLVGNAVYHYDGSNFVELHSPDIKQSLNLLKDIWGGGPNDIFTVGDDGNILHSKGIMAGH